MVNHYLISIANYEWLKHTAQPLVPSWFCNKNIHGICFNPVALRLPFNRTYVNTNILQVFGVDILPSPMNTITDIIFKLHDRNYSVGVHNCAHWVADTPKNLHPNTLGNHFEIHFQWHINSSLVNKPCSKIFTTETLDLDYSQLLQDNIEISLDTILVAQLAYLYYRQVSYYRQCPVFGTFASRAHVGLVCCAFCAIFSYARSPISW